MISEFMKTLISKSRGLGRSVVVTLILFLYMPFSYLFGHSQNMFIMYAIVSISLFAFIEMKYWS